MRDRLITQRFFFFQNCRRYNIIVKTEIVDTCLMPNLLLSPVTQPALTDDEPGFLSQPEPDT